EVGGGCAVLVDRPFSLHARSNTPRSPTKLPSTLWAAKWQRRSGGLVACCRETPSTLWAAAPSSVLGGPLICSRTCAESGSGGSSRQAPRAPARLGCGRRSALGTTTAGLSQTRREPQSP